MPKKVCVARKCHRYTAPGKSMCVIHAAEQRKQNRSPFNSFYASKPWRFARERQLADHPLCQYRLEDDQECGQVTIPSTTSSNYRTVGHPGIRPTSSRSAVATTRSSTPNGGEGRLTLAFAALVAGWVGAKETGYLSRALIRVIAGPEGGCIRMGPNAD